MSVLKSTNLTSLRGTLVHLLTDSYQSISNHQFNCGCFQCLLFLLLPSSSVPWLFSQCPYFSHSFGFAFFELFPMLVLQVGFQVALLGVEFIALWAKEDYLFILRLKLGSCLLSPLLKNLVFSPYQHQLRENFELIYRKYEKLQKDVQKQLMQQKYSKILQSIFSKSLTA